MINKKIFFLSLLFLSMISHGCFCISIGSNTTVSRQNFVTFPAIDSNNTMLGFGEFINGLKMETGATCTFNDLFPVAGDISFGSGIFTLQKDVVFHNTTNIYRGGRIMGQSHAFEFNENSSYYMFSAILNRIGDMRFVTQDSVPTSASSASWSINRTYLAVTNDGTTSPELKIYTFDGTTLTLTSNGSIDLGINAREARWRPTGYYLAVCRNVTTGNEILIYERRIYNGTTVNTGGAEVGYNADACDWHPSGNYLLAATDDPTAQLKLYSFSGGSLTLTQSLYISPAATLNNDSIRWAPGGKYVVVGTEALSSGPELRLFSFNGSTLTYTANAEVGYGIDSLDWSPSGTFIAVGLLGATTNIRVFSHKVWNGTLTEETTAAISLSSPSDGPCVDWGRDGNSILIANANGSSSQLFSYTFDKTMKTFTLLDSYNLNGNAYGVAFSRDGLYAEVGLISVSNNIKIFAFDTGLQQDPFYFRDTAIIINGTTMITVPWYIEGACTLDLKNYTLSCTLNGALIVRPGATLTIQNTMLSGLKANQLYCMTDNGSIILENCAWALANDYTFSRGALQYVSDVIFTGTNTFIYSASRTSTVASHGRIYFDIGTTFSYAPRVAKKNLLYFPDKSAQCYLDGATLFSTRTGLALSDGTLFFDNKVTVSSQAKNSGEAIIFDSTMQVNVLGAAILDVYGMALFL